MFGRCVLIGIGISLLSTLGYSVFTYNSNDIRDKRNEYITIFSIILIVSILILFISSGNSEMLVKTGGGIKGSISPTMSGGKPPF